MTLQIKKTLTIIEIMHQEHRKFLSVSVNMTSNSLTFIFAYNTIVVPYYLMNISLVCIFANLIRTKVF